jgi:hypothetical protein
VKTGNAIINTNLRLNLNRDEDRMAWNYLQNRDKTRYPSYSKTIVIALNDFFRRQQRLAEDPFLETREREDAFCRKLSGYLLHDLEPILANASIQSVPSASDHRNEQKANPTDLEERNRELADKVLSIFG